MEAMEPTAPEASLRSLPSVDAAVQALDVAPDFRDLPRQLLTDLVREAIDDLRAEILEGRLEDQRPPLERIRDRCAESARQILAGSLQPVINATGVILHTNLGRAPLGPSARDELARIAGRYTNLEFDLQTGRRGRRDDHVGGLLRRLLGLPALVVNNNAAAIFLVLRELARGGEVIVSRGELVEIGDGFRIPEIIEASGASLREVGATNRTGIEDYRRAIGPHTKALLRVHPSNFRQIGFTGKPSVGELAELAFERQLPLVEDLGSGCILNLESAGIDGEPTVAASLEAGASIVTFSGDKLLGGPQAGIIAGDEAALARIRRNPLFRALRVDKLVLAALSATLRDYLKDSERRIPAIRRVQIPMEELRRRAERFVRRLRQLNGPPAEATSGDAVLGGGSTPMQTLASVVVAVTPPEDQPVHRMEASLRSHQPPVVARIEGGRIVLDFRTVAESEDEELLAAVVSASAQEVSR